MRKLANISRGLISLSLAAMISSCGYGFTQNSFLPADIHSVYIDTFVNRSRDVGIEKELTTALRSEFYRRGTLRVVDNPEAADAIISGVVRQLTNNVASVNRHNEVLQFEAALTVDIAVRRRDPDVMLWEAQSLRLSRIYSGSRAAVVTTSSEFATGNLNSTDVRRLTDIQLTEASARDSRYQLMADFAADLRQRLTEMF
jgi:outer membrane lipopolysaccharide assembly protein LptE/RlpB